MQTGEETRVALISLIVENPDAVEAINDYKYCSRWADERYQCTLRKTGGTSGSQQQDNLFESIGI